MAFIEVVPSLCVTFLREVIYKELSAVKMAVLEFSAKKKKKKKSKSPNLILKECQYKYRIKYKYKNTK